MATDPKPAPTPRTRNNAVIVILVLIVLVILSAIFWLPPVARELAEQPWTGFGEYIQTETTEVTTFNDSGIETGRQITEVRTTQRGKTLWDWVQIFIVPLVLAVGGALLSSTIQHNQDVRAEALKQAEKDRAQIEAGVERDRNKELAQIERDRMQEQFNITREQMTKELQQSRELTEKQNRAGLYQAYIMNIDRTRTSTNPLDARISAIRGYTVATLMSLGNDGEAIQTIAHILNVVEIYENLTNPGVIAPPKPLSFYIDVYKLSSKLPHDEEGETEENTSA